MFMLFMFALLLTLRGYFKGQNMLIYVIDDEQSWRDVILRKLKEILNQKEISNADIIIKPNENDLLSNDIRPDILILDVDMGEGRLDGFEIAKEYRKKDPNGIIFFLTSYVERAREGYYVNAYRFIDKAHLEELSEALNSYLALHLQDSFLNVTLLDDTKKELKLSDIIFIESYGRHLRIHLANENIELKGKISDFENELKDKDFFLTHRSVISNLHHIDRYEKKRIYFDNDEDAELSQRRFDEFENAFLHYEMRKK